MAAPASTSSANGSSLAPRPNRAVPAHMTLDHHMCGRAGPDGMVNRQHTTSWRAPRMLSAEQQEELRAALAGPAPDGAKHWTCRAVADWMAATLGRPVAVQRGWEYLQRLKQSRQTPRPRHALADAAQQAEFKKKSARSSAP